MGGQSQGCGMEDLHDEPNAKAWSFSILPGQRLVRQTRGNTIEKEIHKTADWSRSVHKPRTLPLRSYNAKTNIVCNRDRLMSEKRVSAKASFVRCGWMSLLLR